MSLFLDFIWSKLVPIFGKIGTHLQSGATETNCNIKTERNLVVRETKANYLYWAL